MKRKLLLLTVLLGCLISACTRDTGLTVEMVEGEPVYSLNIDMVHDTLDVPLSRFVSSCEMIRLNNSEAALFGRAYHTEVSENYIAVKSYDQTPVKLFSRKGSYLRDIGVIGKGPGEYRTLIDLQIDEERNRIYLMPFATTDRIHVYSLEGEYIKDIRLAFIQRKFAASVEGDMVTVVSMPFEQDSVVAFRQTMQGEVLNYIPAREGLYSMSFDGEVFPGFNNGLYDFFITASDTLYHYLPEKGRLLPVMTATKTYERWWPKIFREIPGYFQIRSGNFTKTSRSWSDLIIEKETKSAYYAHFKNDFFGNIPFQFFFHNGRFVNNIPALDFKNQLEESLESGDMDVEQTNKVKVLIESIDVEDNNVILTGRLK